MVTHSRRRRTERAAPDAALLDAAARGDEDGVRIALARGADVNAADVAMDSTVITCAIAGDRCAIASMCISMRGLLKLKLTRAFLQQLGGR